MKRLWMLYVVAIAVVWLLSDDDAPPRARVWYALARVSQGFAAALGRIGLAAEDQYRKEIQP